MNPEDKNKTAFPESDPAYGGAQASSAEPASGDDKTWATLSHIALFVFGIFGPLIIMMVKKDESKFIEHHAKEALNFQLSVLIVQILSIVTCVGPIIVAVAGVVYAIMAAIEANKGNYYRYPYTFRMIK